MPAGNVIVVREVSAFNANAVSNEIAHLFSSVTSITIYQKDLSPQVSDIESRRTVLLPGDTIVASNGGDVDMVVSGYLLTLP